MASVFARPRARPPLSSVSSQQNFVSVGNEDELLAALTVLPRSDGVCYGRGVNIVGDITLTTPVRLLRQHSGIVITSSSNARITTKSAIDSCFIVETNANDVTIERMSISQDTSVTQFVRSFFNTNNTVRNISVYGRTSVIIMMTIGSCQRPSVVGCSADVSSESFASIIGSGITQSFFFTVSGNRGFGATSTMLSGQGGVFSGNSLLGELSLTVTNCVISGNTFNGRIFLGATSRYNAICNNAMLSNNISTSSSAGDNSIVGNTNVGTITNAATDAVTSNT